MSMLSPLTGPLRTFLYAFLGIALAWLGFRVSWWWVAAVVALAWVFVLLTQRLARGWVTVAPLRALRWMELRVVGISITSAAAAAAAIVIGVTLVVPDGSPSKELMTAVTSAITALVTGVAISADDEDRAIGEFVREQFQQRFVRDTHDPGPGQVSVPVGSEAHLALFTTREYGWEDWTRENRWARVRVVDEFVRPSTVVAAG